MKKVNKHIVLTIITIILISLVNVKSVKADVGDFETYDSGSSYSWDSSDDYSSSWDDDYDSSYGRRHYYDDDYYYRRNKNYYRTELKDIIIYIVIIVMAVAIVIIRGIINSKRSKQNIYYNGKEKVIKSEQEIESEIKTSIPNFDKNQFLPWVKNLFIELQESWTRQDWSQMKNYETKDLAEKHQNQIQWYKANNQINVMDRINVTSVSLVSFNKYGEKEVITVNLDSQMIDYIIDANSKQVLKGDMTTVKYSTYKLTFVKNQESSNWLLADLTRIK